jgi:hypothetical protein
MQSVTVATTVRIGNHTLTAAESAAGLAQRLPFVDEAGAPVDPDVVTLALTAPTGTTFGFAYPAPGPDDAGTLTKQEDGRFYVDWTPAAGEDGVWRWFLKGEMELGAGQGDQDVYYVQREITPGP